jgi:hypothetical protein
LIAFSARKFFFLRKVPKPDLTCFSTDSLRTWFPHVSRVSRLQI